MAPLSTSTPLRRRPANVLLYGRDRFGAGTTRLARIKLQSRSCWSRVTLRTAPGFTACHYWRRAGTRCPPARKATQITSMAWLETFRNSPTQEQILLRIARRGTAGLSIRRLMAEIGLSREAAEQLWQPLITSHRSHQIPGEILLAAEALESACKGISSLLQQYPSGLKRSEMKTRTSLGPVVLDFALERLATAQKLRLKGELVCPVETSPAPAGAEDATLSAIAAIYRKAGLSAPLISEVATTLRLKRAKCEGSSPYSCGKRFWSGWAAKPSSFIVKRLQVCELR